MSMMRATVLASAAAMMFGVVATAQAGVTVDLFTDPVAGQVVQTETLGATVNNQAGVYASIVGGYRDLSITKTDDNNGSVNVGVAKLQVDTGTLVQSNELGVKSLGVITWDGANNAGAQGASVSTTGLGGIDFTVNGGDRFLADVLQADLGFDYQIQVWDMAGHSSTLSASVQVPVAPPGETADYLFSWFNLSNGTYCDGVASPPACADPANQLDFTITRSGIAGNIDFSNIGALQLRLSNATTYSVDLSLGSIRSNVPEPGMLSLVGLALLGVGAGLARKGRIPATA